MANTNRTNPAYAYLAYRRAILNHITHLLVTDYVAPTDGEANESIFSDDVFKTDSQVPISEIKLYLEEIQAEDARLQLEMNQFEFRAAPPKNVKEAPNDSAESEEPPGSGGATASPAQHQRRRRKAQPN